MNLQKNKKKIDDEKTVKTEEDCDANAVANKFKELTTGFNGVKWSLTFSEIVNEMILHHMKKLREFGDSALVLCSFDGAEHGSNKTNIISFSTQIYSYKMGKLITTTTTRNLYTWMQIMDPKKRYVVLNAVKEHFRQKQDARHNITKIGDNCKLHYCLHFDSIMNIKDAGVEILE